jgi:hypothetical protein
MIFAAQLTNQGMTGLGPLRDAEDYGRPWARNWSPWQRSHSHHCPTFKPSTQIHTQLPIGLALELRDQIALSDIAALRITAIAPPSAALQPSQKWIRRPARRPTTFHAK